MTQISEKKKHEYCNKAIKLEQDARFLYLALGEMLYNIRKDTLYEPFWTSWAEFCMEFKDLSQSSISKLIAIYEMFILKYGYKPETLSKAGGWTKLYALTHCIKSKAEAKHWLTLAETYSKSDLDKFLVEAKTGLKMSSCKHPDTYMIEICKDCKEKWEVFPKKK